MEAREFRIGNFIYGNYQILEIDRNGCLVVDANYPEDSSSEIYIDFENIKPIQLSQEIFLKCGFQLLNGLFVNDIFEIGIDKDDFMFNRFTLRIDKSLMTKVKYLHQLQNLYFALTGKELIVNI